MDSLVDYLSEMYSFKHMGEYMRTIQKELFVRWKWGNKIYSRDI